MKFLFQIQRNIAKKYKKVLLHNEIDFEENQHTETIDFKC